MEHEELIELVVIAEDIRDGRRPEPFTHGELILLCNELRRAIALLGASGGEAPGTDAEGDL